MRWRYLLTAPPCFLPFLGVHNIFVTILCVLVSAAVMSGVEPINVAGRP